MVADVTNYNQKRGAINSDASSAKEMLSIAELVFAYVFQQGCPFYD
jgi:predicted metal-dependent TIM-barrel fold hydrolase